MGSAPGSVEVFGQFREKRIPLAPGRKDYIDRFRQKRSLCDKIAGYVGSHGYLQIAGVRKVQELGPFTQPAQLLSEFTVLWIVHFAADVHLIDE